MSRYFQLDSDSGRLPDGMERVGYDTDTQTYSYRDQNGSHWEGVPGVRYGELHRSGNGYLQPMSIAATDEAMRKGNAEAWRYMLPFFLLVSVCLLLLFRFLWSAGPAPLLCAENSVRYLVKPGDSCWSIADERGAKVEDLVGFNQGLDCSLLKAGAEICVPAPK